MGLKIINESTLSSIADAIRVKTGTADTIKVSDFATIISEISTGSGVSESEMFKLFALADALLNGTPINESDWSESTLNEIYSLCYRITGEE